MKLAVKIILIAASLFAIGWLSLRAYRHPRTLWNNDTVFVVFVSGAIAMIGYQQLSRWRRRQGMRASEMVGGEDPGAPGCAMIVFIMLGATFILACIGIWIIGLLYPSVD